jgi:hypothetical protein
MVCISNYLTHKVRDPLTPDKDLVKTWKFSGKISKEYDSQLKGYINILNNAGTSKMQLPSNEKNSLGIVQNFVVFQIFIYSPKLFNIEIIISDTLKVIISV